MTAHHDSGRPMPDEVEVTAKIAYHKFDTHTRQVSIRNTGVNTLYMSFDGKHWHDVACGTSWDDRVNVQGFYHCTQTGKTYFVVVGIQLSLVAGQKPLPVGDARDLEQ
jgi:hypothetical protein